MLACSPATYPPTHSPTHPLARLQKGTWSPAFHPFCPPTFKAAAAELLRISRKHGGAVGPGGRLRWAFTPATLASLLLPALADDMSPWL